MAKISNNTSVREETSGGAPSVSADEVASGGFRQDSSGSGSGSGGGSQFVFGRGNAPDSVNEVATPVSETHEIPAASSTAKSVQGDRPSVNREVVENGAEKQTQPQEPQQSTLQSGATQPEHVAVGASADSGAKDSASILANLDLDNTGLGFASRSVSVDPSLNQGPDYSKKVKQRRAEGIPSGDKVDTKVTQRSRENLDRMAQAAVGNTDTTTRDDILKGGNNAAIKPKVGNVAKGAVKAASSALYSMRTAHQERKVRKRETKQAVGAKSTPGNFYGKTTAHKTIPLGYVGLGRAYVEEALRYPDNRIAEFVMENYDIDMTQPGAIDQLAQACVANPKPVAVFKSPDLAPQSSVKLKMLIVDGDLIEMHPMAYKQFNADTDGDSATMSCVQNVINRCADSVDYLIDLAGDLMIDPDFFPRYIAPGGIKPDGLEEATLEAIKSVVTSDDRLARLMRDAYFASNEDEFVDTFKLFLSDAHKKNRNGLLKMITDSYSLLQGLRNDHFGYARPSLTDAELMQFMPKPRSAEDRRLYDFTENAIALRESFQSGRGVANFQMLRAMMHDYLGEPKGTNPSYRFTANMAKPFTNYSDKIRIGSDYVDIPTDEVVNCTLRFIESAKMSESLTLSNRAKLASEFIKDLVRAEVGSLPDGSSDNLAWLNRFFVAYQKIVPVVNAANINVSVDFTSIKSRGKTPQITWKANDIARALRDIYGDEITIAALLGRDALMDKDPFGEGRANPRAAWRHKGKQVVRKSYGSWTLNRFAKENKWFFTSVESENAAKKSIVTKDGYFEKDAMFLVVQAMAAMRTSTASAYHTKVFKGPNSVVSKTKDILEKLSRGDTSFELVELVNATDPDVFAYFGMDFYQGFIESKYGKAMLSNKYDLGSIRLAMTTEQRMSRIHQAMQKRDKTLADKGKLTESQIERLYDDVIAEENILASASWVWRAVILDSRMYARNEECRPFKQFKEGTAPYSSMFKNWSRLENIETLEEVLLDVSLSLNDKEMIVADCVRIYENFHGFQPYEVAEALERNEQSNYSVLPPTSTSVMAATNEFNRMYARWKSGSNAASMWERFIGSNHITESTIETTLRDWADHPGAYAFVSHFVLADAMCAILDKTFHQSEKGQQHVWTNALYSALSIQRNGGQFSGVYMTDDRAIGLQPLDKVSPHDVICVLAGKKVLHAYDLEGNIIRLSKDTLLKGRTYRQFFGDNPEVTTYLRKHAVVTTEGGTAYLAGVGPYFETSETSAGWFGEYASDFMDDPSFAALVALITKTDGITAASQRVFYGENIMRLFVNLLIWAKKAINADDFCLTALEKLNIITDRKDLAEEDSSSDEKMPKWLVLGNYGVDVGPAIDMYSTIRDRLSVWYPKLKDIPHNKWMEKIKEGLKVETDLSSCYAYNDVRQELTGSKTEVSTGVNGIETWNCAAPITSLDLEDSYADLGSIDNEAALATFGSCMTSLGKTFAEFTPEDTALLDNGEEIVVEVPAGFQSPDKSLNDASEVRQVPAVYSYLLISRDQDAEALNLKAKKSGDDGMFSVTKYSKYLTQAELEDLEIPSSDYEIILGELQNLFDSEHPEESIFSVRLSLARRLEAINKLCKHEFVTLADCMNIANLMIGVGEDGRLILRSISMLATAIRNNLNYDLIDSGSREDVRIAALDAVSKSGRVLYDLPDHLGFRETGTWNGVTTLERPRSSSVELNFNLFQILSEQTGLPVADKKIHKIKPDKEKDLDFVLRGMFGKDSEYFIAGLEVVPPKCVGPQAVWYMEQTPTEEQRAIALAQGNTIVYIGRWLRGSSSLPSSVLDGSYYILPCFEQRLVDEYEYSNTGQFSVFRRPVDNLVTLVEDSLNEYSLGDAGMQVFSALTDRLSVHWKDDTPVSLARAFASTFQAFPDATFDYHLATEKELQAIIEKRDTVMIDPGVAPGGTGVEEHWRMMMDACDRYVDAYRDQMDEFRPGGTLYDSKPGEVVSWAACIVNRNDGSKPLRVFAPIMLFDYKGTNGVSQEFVPSDFRITSAEMEIQGDTPIHSFANFAWEYAGDITDHGVKFFEGMAAANKFFVNLRRAVEGPTLADGTPVDACVAPESTVSRRVGSNRRLGTLQTLMCLARKRGYNFAEAKGSFPGEPMFTNVDGEAESIKERLKHDYLSIAEWESVGVSGTPSTTAADITFNFSSDRKLDTWLKNECLKYAQNGGNPSDLLASQFDDRFTDVWWEFECMFQTTTAYQDGLMGFLNSMDDKLCASSTEDNTEGYLFRCMPPDGGFGTHCMAMEIPRRRSDGTYFTSWENVYTSWSMFNFNDFTGAHRPNVNGFSDALDAVASHELSGRKAANPTWRQFLRFAMSTLGEFKQPQFGMDIINLSKHDSEEE